MPAGLGKTALLLWALLATAQVAKKPALTQEEVDAMVGLWKCTGSTGININAADAAFKAGVEAAGGNPAKYDWQEVNSQVFTTVPPLTLSTARLYVVGVDPASGLFWSYHTRTTEEGVSMDRSVGRAERGPNGKIHMTFIRSDSPATSFRELGKDGILKMLYYGDVMPEDDRKEHSLLQQDVRYSSWEKITDEKEEQEELETIASLLPFSTE
ncbi:expressed protein [Chlorella variabilis]|uniref:Expressed protein n=1 Tax=Chlorella variabilis TaxID=554065 RepID=E1ZG01_CHLVA|nr:expressed protein [Chlorella variabilis]EFN55377.1 expressed protein [Chlorella variabilis]|eukprot:XP_005847479.1 expressed protein [Chlorella variabilis]